MIVYDSKEKWGLLKVIIKTFKESYNMRQLLFLVLLTAIYASVFTIVNLEYLHQKVAIDTVFFSLLGVVLSLFLVFRLNSAYDRWWEGRKQWGKLVNDCRTFALNLNSIIPSDDKKRRRFFVKAIANFCVALQWHLRNDIKYGRFIHINKDITEDIENAMHVPNEIASHMFNEVENMWKEKIMNDLDKFQLKELMQGFIDVLGACERIKKTPIPFSHSTFIKMFTVIYIFILPFGLISMFGYLTIPAVTVMGFAMFGINVISDEIEDPFGLDANDLPTGRIADVIRENVYEILQVKSSFERVKVAQVAEVQH